MDVECIDALSTALSNWDPEGKDGAIVVVSHDRSFCEDVGFTHVGTVKDGKLTLEERDLKDSDWQQYEINGSASASIDSAAQTVASEPEVVLTPEEEEELKKKRKLAFNAPKRIAKLEKEITDAEMRIAKLDEEMMEVGNDVGELTDIQKKKDKEQEKVDRWTEEWEELEELLIEMAE